MRKFIGAFLIAIAITSVIGGIYFVVPLLRAEDHGHVLIGALYILIFAVPLVSVALICVFGGLYLLSRNPKALPEPVSDRALPSGLIPQSWTLAQALIWLSYLILAWAVLDLLMGLPSAFIAGFSMSKLALIVLSFLEFKLVACVAAYLMGKWLQRQAPVQGQS